MEGQSLSAVFEKHLGFPGDGRARVSADLFAQRLFDRQHGLDGTQIVDWVDHFFEHEHSFEQRSQEFRAFAGEADRQQAVLEFDLGEQEFVVVDSEDGEEVVVVSSAGAIALERTSDFVTRLQAAQLPAEKQYRPSDVFRGGGGERAFFVNASGAVTAVDSKTVLQLIRGATVRAEPVARVARASERLVSFAPERVTRPSAPSSSPSSPGTHTVSEVRRIAKSEVVGGASKVTVLERGQLREERGSAARWWQRLAAAATDGGRRTEGAIGSASAVALGKQTWAVKVGAVTALVQRPAAPVSNSSLRMAASAERRADRLAPEWLKAAVADAPASRRAFWIDPRPNAADEAGRPAWVDRVLSLASEVRRRARQEAAGDLDPAPTISRASAVRPVPFATSPSFSDLATAGASTQELVDARYEITSDGRLESRGPISTAGALPATTLRALYTGLERTAAREGRHLSVVRVELDAVGGGEAAVRRLEVETTPRVAPGLPPATTAIDFADGRIAGVSASAERPLGEPQPSRPRTLATIFALPFEEGAAIRVGPELTSAIGREVDQTLAARPVMVPATVETQVEVLGTPGRVTVRVPDLRGNPVVSVPSAVSPGGIPGGRAAVDLSGFGWVDWATAQTRRDVAETSEGFGSEHSKPRFPSSFFTFEGQGVGALGGARSLIGSRAAMAVAPLGLADLNASRAPSPELALEDESAERVIVDQPLHTQMTEARVAATEAAAEGRDPRFAMQGDLRFAMQGDPRFAMQGDPRFSSLARGAGRLSGSPGTSEFFGAYAGDPTLANARMLLRAQGAAPAVVAPASGSTSAVAGSTSAAGASPASSSRASSSRSAAAKAAASGASSRSSGSAAAPTPVRPVAPALGPGADAHARPTELARWDAATQTGAAAPSRSRAGAASVAGGSEAHADRVADRVAHLASPAGGPAPSRTSGESGAVVASPAAFAASGAAAEGAPVYRKAEGEPIAMSPTSGQASGGAQQADSARSFMEERFGADFSNVRVHSEGEAQALNRDVGAQAFTHGNEIHLGGVGQGSGQQLIAHEMTHVIQQGMARPRRRGAMPLEFRYPKQSRWWPSGPKGGSAAASSRNAAGGMLVGNPSRAAAAGGIAAGAPAGVAVASAGAASPVAAGSREPAFGAQGAPSQALVARSDFAAAEGGEASHAGPAPAAPREGEVAYVTVSGTGEARVVGQKAVAAQHAKGRGSNVDMTVVAAVAPQAPSLEQMATAGHERPHAKGKKEGTKAGATPKTDSLSLQGTVDSLAQRIYHRLKRRLAADRERFGG